MKKTFYILAFSIAGVSCEQSIDPFERPVCYLATLQNGSYAATYSYHSPNQLVSYTDTGGNKLMLTYDQNGRLNSAARTYSDGSADTYHYKFDANHRLVEINWGGNTSECVFTYNSNSQVTRVQYLYKTSASSDFIPSFYRTFTYSSSGTKNYSEIYYYNASGQLTDKESYHYDSKPNPFQSLNAFRLDHVIPEPTPSNNPLKIVYTPTGGSPVTTNYSYTYNSKGYRITQNTGAGSNLTSYSYTNCK